MSKQDTKVTVKDKDVDNIDLGNYENQQTENDKENDMLDSENDYAEPYAEFGEDFEDEPMFEKTNRQKGVRKVRD